MAIEEGNTARVVAPVIQGVVKEIEYDRKTGVKRNLLEWTDAEGQHQERWFFETELELVPDQAPASE